jgi:ribose-phosphate pyrophosphokinase
MPGRTASPGPRTPISAKLVANLITRAGADRVLTLDLHAGQIQGFFDIPTDNLFAAPVMVRDIKENYDLKPTSWWSRPTSAAWCAPARSPSASTRRSPSSTSAASGRRVRGDEHHRRRRGPRCILVDDIVDSGGTLATPPRRCSRKGAKSVSAYITHGVLSGGAVARITASKLKELVITDSIQPTEAVRAARNIRVSRSPT